jgi:hypothetical protein
MPRWPSLSRRKRWLLAIVLVAAIAGISFFFLFKGDNRITLSNFRQLKDGMTREEVEQILGGPGSDTAEPIHLHWLRIATQRPTDWAFLCVVDSADPDRQARVTKHWHSVTAWVSVNFDEENRLLGATFRATCDPFKTSEVP